MRYLAGSSASCRRAVGLTLSRYDVLGSLRFGFRPEGRPTGVRPGKLLKMICLERRNSIRPCVPSHVAYKAERGGNEPFSSPWKTYPRSQERHRNHEATVYRVIIHAYNDRCSAPFSRAFGHRQTTVCSGLRSRRCYAIKWI
jgi:hypothetical protein